MRIALLAHAGSIHTRRWAGFFAERGHDVHVISLTAADGDPGCTLHVLGDRRRVSQERTNWSYLTSVAALHRIVRALRPDLLNAHFLSSHGILGAAVRPRDVPFVVSVHGSDVLVIPRRSPWMRVPSRWALRRADLVTSVAEHLTEAVRHLAGTDVPTLTLQYGVDRDLFRPPDGDAARPPVVLSTRRLAAVANLDPVFDAFRRLDASHSPLQLIVLGDGDRRAAWEASTRDLAASGRVAFRGETGPEGIAEALREAAIYVSATRTDGASLSLLEAMACGAFPVVSDIPANREWIEPGTNGLLFPPADSAALAERLAAAWTDAAARDAAAARNRRIVEERADFRANMERIEARFLSLVADRGRSV